MANQEQLDLLKQGVKVWNAWREEHPDIQPDLINADLSGADLGGAILIDANLSRADLGHADLGGARLGAADLHNADLRHADLGDADLGGADLNFADLSGAILSGAILIDANLSGAHLLWTVLGDVDLSTVKGLETVEHRGPSTIGIDTIYRSQGKIPEAFLKGAGVDDTFITYIGVITFFRPIFPAKAPAHSGRGLKHASFPSAWQQRGRYFRPCSLRKGSEKASLQRDAAVKQSAYKLSGKNGTKKCYDPKTTFVDV